MREPRYSVDITVDETTATLFTAGRVTNLSRGGLFIETPNPLPLAADIDLALRLPDLDTVLRVRGRVAWTYDVRRHSSQIMTGSGIRFVEIRGDQLQLLETYLARLRPTTTSSSAYL
ncbi:MAG TPA: PilZ domain-containing protein, partial [Vicinamibacteria bacterium]|nr:PilZ domain-containing protein [Vicinamibacteria bacterium]